MMYPIRKIVGATATSSFSGRPAPEPLPSVRALRPASTPPAVVTIHAITPAAAERLDALNAFVNSHGPNAARPNHTSHPVVTIASVDPVRAVHSRAASG